MTTTHFPNIRSVLLSFVTAAMVTLGVGVLSTAAAKTPGPTQPLGPYSEIVPPPVLPAPPRPSSEKLLQSSRLQTSSQAGTREKTTRVKPPPAPTSSNQFAGAPGSNSNQRTLVLYDNAGEFAWLGEAYAVMAGQLASHGSSYVIQPAAAYQSGELLNYTGLIYIGSVYGTELPAAFLDDVLAGTRPVLWMNYNIDQLSARPNFSTYYGWTLGTFDTVVATTVTYKGIDLKRNPLVGAGLWKTQIGDPSLASVIATATPTDGTSSAWATRSRNLTYIGEVPFSYVGSDDRYLAAADLISQVSNPAMPDRKRALVRIEDVGADADPAELRAIADYLSSRGVPFSVAVIPLYLDPNGAYNGGTADRVPLAQAPLVVSALKYMQSKGGTLLMHGYTHQFSNVANPYTGASADDFEFYTAHIDAANYVIYGGPVPGDSAKWASNRLSAAFKEFAAAGLSKPTIFEFPHYAGSAVDYQAVRQQFDTRYDRGLYAKNWCPAGNCGTGQPDYTRIYGQYFPYLVRDIFNSIVIPESLGNVELVESNHNPPRLPADILASAQRNSVIRDGVQSFFFHPYIPLIHLKAVVEGLQGRGYQFVSANTIKQG